MHKLIQRIRQRQEGITGLETAIILIAFVIVASVFAYVVLSAGLFSAQKTKEAVNSGIQSTMSVVEVRGDIVVKMVSSVVTDIYFCVGIPAAGSSVDFTPSTSNSSSVVISYNDTDSMIPSANWTIQKLSTINTDNILDKNELFLVKVDLSNTANVSIGAYHKFALEIKPPSGPVLSIERTVPGRVSQYVNMH